MQELASVVILVCNTGDCLKECVDSISRKSKILFGCYISKYYIKNQQKDSSILIRGFTAVILCCV